MVGPDIPAPFAAAVLHTPVELAAVLGTPAALVAALGSPGAFEAGLGNQLVIVAQTYPQGAFAGPHRGGGSCTPDAAARQWGAAGEDMVLGRAVAAFPRNFQGVP